MRFELISTDWNSAILTVILHVQIMHLTRLELATNGLKVRCSTTELQVQNPALIEGKHMNTNNWEVVFVLGLSSRGENRTHGNSFIRTAPSPLGYSRIVGRYECHLIPTLYRLVSQTWKGIWEIGKPRNRTVNQLLERNYVTITPHAGVKLQNGGHQYLVSEGKWWSRTTEYMLHCTT